MRGKSAQKDKTFLRGDSSTKMPHSPLARKKCQRGEPGEQKEGPGERFQGDKRGKSCSSNKILGMSYFL